MTELNKLESISMAFSQVSELERHHDISSAQYESLA